jgi:hypothetical protein
MPGYRLSRSDRPCSRWTRDDATISDDTDSADRVGSGRAARGAARLSPRPPAARPQCLVPKSQEQVGYPCCDNGDAEHAEAEWDTTKGGYKVFLKNPLRPDEAGQWFEVPDSAVVERPNLNGIAMVWWSPYYGMDGGMTPKWRCFIPGAGG